jgi:hypothetical protein
MSSAKERDLRRKYSGCVREEQGLEVPPTVYPVIATVVRRTVDAGALLACHAGEFQSKRSGCAQKG